MDKFERTEESYIRRLIDEHTEQPELGKVTKVFEHTDPDDYSNFEANVKLRDSEKERRRIPIATSPFMGAIAVPEEGDTVLVDFLDGESESPVVTGVVHNTEDRAPLGQAGTFRLRKGELYIEMDPDGDWVRLAHKSGDDATPNSKIELDKSGEVTLTGYKRCETDEGVTASGDGVTQTFTLSHSLGQTPSTVSVDPRSADASQYNYYVSSKSADGVEITYHTAPVTGSENLVFDVTTFE